MIYELSTENLLITFSLGCIKIGHFFINKYQPKIGVKFNIISNKFTSFYPFFRFSTNKRKRVDETEKETFDIFQNAHLKPKTINARKLLKSFQPIHKHIIIRNNLFKINLQKIKKMKY